ncbi:MAG TPA: hypothetical protein VJQ86_09325 [Rhodanobacteraceae bacterium]|nr:hypothetical protein [Rhodanobacteraceae bacterium]
MWRDSGGQENTAGQDGEPARFGQSFPAVDCKMAAQKISAWRSASSLPIRQNMRSAGPSWPALFQETTAMRKLILAAIVAAAFSIPAFAAQTTPATSAPATEAAAPAASAPATTEAPKAMSEHHHHAKKHSKHHRHHAKKAESSAPAEAPASSGK